MTEGQRRLVLVPMQQWTRLVEDEATFDLALAVDAELFRLASVSRWLDASGGRREGRHPAEGGVQLAARNVAERGDPAVQRAGEQLADHVDVRAHHTERAEGGHDADRRRPPDRGRRRRPCAHGTWRR